MWYLLACIATPMATNCTAPVEMPSAEVCEFMAEQWRGNALRGIVGKRLTYAQ